MSDSLAIRWSENPNAPQIAYSVHSREEANFAGDFIAVILYGIIIVLFFRCVGALLTNHTRLSIRWALVAHTVVMFSLVTVATAMGFNLRSIAYIDNREFGDPTSSGPLGYKLHLYSTTRRFSICTFQLNQWLADGLLLYRCCVIYSMNYWVIAFPCLMYIASLVLGLVGSVWAVRTGNGYVPFDVGTSYFSISLSLNVLLTLMIVTRLVLHSRQLQSAMGVTAGAGRLYKALITLLVESCALYAVTFLPFLVSGIAKNEISKTFWPILNEIQVLAPFLIIHRVANQRAFTRETAPESISSIQFQDQQESMGGGRTFLDASTTDSMERDGGAAGGHGVDAGTPLEEFHCDGAQGVLGNSPQSSPVFLAPPRNSLSCRR